jgi:acyl-homoserine-lactone acylase
VLSPVKKHKFPGWSHLRAMLAAATAALTSCAGTPESEQARLARLAASVTITRDSFGVPHVCGPTDASVVFGAAYARAEDQFHLMEAFYAEALGRKAEIVGPEALGSDLLVRAMEIERHARAEYLRLEPELKDLCLGFADGVNYFLGTHPEVRPRLLGRFEPWFPLAGELAFWSLYSLFNHPDRFGLRLDDLVALLAPEHRGASAAIGRAPSAEPSRLACNAWAVGPSRSASGRPMLLIDAHIALDAAYELHLHSRAGLHVAGFANYGYGALPITGFNERIAWMLTENAPDWVDLYEETFDDPRRPLAYRDGAGHRDAVEWQERVGVSGTEGNDHVVARFRKTRHGPILAERDGKAVAFRVAGLETGGVLGQLYAMARARDLDQFRAALAINALSNQNVVYADADGNILYVYNGLIPRRDPRYDWTRPVDGADPAAEWLGMHTLADRPQVLNPPGGWVQSCNASPFVAAPQGNPDPASFPGYMVSAHDTDHPRARGARLLLESRETFTREEFGALHNDTHLVTADEDVPDLLTAFASLTARDPRRRLSPVIEELRTWDRRSALDSVATTLYVHWHERARQRLPGDSGAPPNILAALVQAVSELEATWGTWRTAWGEVNRLQRGADVHTIGGSGAAPFSDARPSVPIAGASGRLGTVNVFSSRRQPGARRRYGVSGRANTAVIELGDRVRAGSVTPFGQCLDPSSPHHADQTPLYATGTLKPMWFWSDELEPHVERAYHPGMRGSR